MNRILIVCYSHSENTKKLAEIIRKKTRADIFYINTEPKYPKDYHGVMEMSKHQRTVGTLPNIKPKLNSLEDYDYIFIGTPNWWSTMSLPIASFLNIYDLSDKTIIPFVTHGGGGQANVVNDMRVMCHNSLFAKELSVYGNGGKDIDKKIENWLQEIFE